MAPYLVHRASQQFQAHYTRKLKLFADERPFLPGYDSALFYGAYAYHHHYDREISCGSMKQYRYPLVIPNGS